MTYDETCGGHHVRAIVKGERDLNRVAAYLPANYHVRGVTVDGVYICGRDVAGWTFDQYVAPRLASGLMWASRVRTV